MAVRAGAVRVRARRRKLVGCIVGRERWGDRELAWWKFIGGVDDSKYAGI